MAVAINAKTAAALRAAAKCGRERPVIRYRPFLSTAHKKLVYAGFVSENLSTDEHPIEQALVGFPARQSNVREYAALMLDIRRMELQAGRKFTREEMNER